LSTNVCGERYNSNFSDVLNNGLLFSRVNSFTADWIGLKSPTTFLLGFIKILLSFALEILSCKVNFVTSIKSNPYTLHVLNVLPAFVKV